MTQVAPAIPQSLSTRPVAVIEFKDVHFSQGPLKVLDGVSFRIERGQTSVVLGPSGTGKSTLLWLILGLWKQEAGTILIDGRDTTTFSDRDWKEARSVLSMVFQENALFDSLTVGENVGYCLMRSSSLTPREQEERIRDTLRLVELEPDRFIDTFPEELSGGQKRRVAIARAVANCDPEVILYDEPTTGLDPHTARRIADLLVKLRDTRGMTSVVVTHEIQDALHVGNHFILLDGGKALYDGSADGLLTAPDARVQQFLEPFLKGLEEVIPRLGESAGRGIEEVMARLCGPAQ
jgi:phospholipid/cholesterol/gamma-HCH transport system ATP-binding protein